MASADRAAIPAATSPKRSKGISAASPTGAPSSFLWKAQAGGSGWTLLTWSPRAGRLVNAWAADHTHGIADGTPVLALDMYEHAYHLDFGAKAAAYVDTTMRNIDWVRVGMRYARAATGAPLKDSPPVDAAGAPMERVDALKARVDRG